MKDYERAMQYSKKGMTQIFDEHDYEGAIISYSKAIEITRGEITTYHYMRGMAYIFSNMPRKAISDLNIAIEDKEGWQGERLSEPYAYRGLAYIELENHAAGDLINQWQENNITDADKMIDMMKEAADRTNSNLSMALDDLTKAIQIDPKNDRAYLWRAEVYWRQKNHTKAVDDYKSAINLNPEYLNHAGETMLQRDIYASLRSKAGY